VPGGPTRSTPFGMRAPSPTKRSGYFRKSMISRNSVIASSQPPTSLKVTPTCSGRTTTALLLPTPRIPPAPPSPIRRYIGYQMAPITASGSTYPTRNEPIGLGGAATE